MLVGVSYFLRQFSSRSSSGKAEIFLNFASFACHYLFILLFFLFNIKKFHENCAEWTYIKPLERAPATYTCSRVVLCAFLPTSNECAAGRIRNANKCSKKKEKESNCSFQLIDAIFLTIISFSCVRGGLFFLQKSFVYSLCSLSSKSEATIIKN